MAESYQERFRKQPGFPTGQHQAAAEAVTAHFAADPRVQAVLLTCSCARGMAAPASCVDIAVLVDPADLPAFQAKESQIKAFLVHDPAVAALQARVPWSAVDLEMISGEFVPGEHHYTSGPDFYEVEIGNLVAWAHPLFLRGPRFAALRAQYLPYYAEETRRTRLAMVKRFAANNLEHVAPFAARGLEEQAFKRLYHAFEEYLQALFIARRIYPIAYDKWLREQIVDVLSEPALYAELRNLLALPAFTLRRLRDRAQRLSALLEALD